jgi:outer membrane receptor for ferrienterochelin and colicins
MTRYLLLIGAALVVSGVGYSLPSYAQSMDYGSLQELFGEPVTTGATGTPQRASEVPANMTIITADEIRQSGSRTIPEILSRVPGLDILQTGENAYAIGVRGYQQPFQPRLLVLLDGRQVFVDDYSRTIWDSIPVNVDDIRQIEVVKGASSALFGSNASGGVINIITKSPAYDDSNVVAASGGTQNSFSGDGTVTKRFGTQNGVKFSAGGMGADEFATGGDVSDNRTFSPSKRYFIESSVFQVAPGLQANTEVSYARVADNTGNTNFYIDSEDTTVYSAKGGLSWQSPVGEISNNNYINRDFTHAVGTNFDSRYITQLIVSQLEDQFKSGADNSFRVALEYRNKQHEDTIASQSFPQAPYFEQNVYSASGTWLWQIDDKMSWTNALRFDHQDMAQTGTLFANSFVTNADYSHVINTWSANSGFVYKPTDKDTLRASYGRGVQIPSFFQESLNEAIPVASHTFYDIEGNPKLKPTIVQNYELGYDRALPTLHSTVKTSIYYEINQDVVGFLAGSFNRTVGSNTLITTQSINVGNSSGLGGELELKGSYNGFRWDPSYSYSRVIDSQGVSDNVGYDGSAPQHHFRLVGGYTIDSWEMDANGQYVTSTHMKRTPNAAVASSPQTPVDGYASLGGRVAYNINDHVTVALSGVNITRATTQENPYPAVERQAFMTLTGKF